MHCCCRFYLSLTWLGGIGLLAGCVTEPSLSIKLNPDVQRPPRSVVVFFPDGMDAYRMRELAAAGRLPNIRKYFLDGGVGVEYAISSLPSITYANCSSMITGLYPGHHGIMGNYWFDRYCLISRYYMTFETYRTVNEHMIQPTLYDMLKEQFTLNIQGHTRRGVTQTIDNEYMFACYWAVGGFIHADWYAGQGFACVGPIANRVKRWPTVIMTYYPGVDEVGHRSGPESEHYAEALINIDNIVGQIIGAMKGAGLHESTYYVLIADHGMAPVGKKTRIDLLAWLRKEKKLRVRSAAIGREHYVDRYRLMESYDAVASVDAGRVAMIHLRGVRDWNERPGPEEVLNWVRSAPSVLDLPAVGWLFTRAGRDRVRVMSREGSAIIERFSRYVELHYRLTEVQGDPLGYRKVPELTDFLAADGHPSRAWLAATARLECPDVVAQAVEMFDSSRTGDVVLMAADGWAFYKGELGGHGSITQRDMRLPMYFAGPDLPGGALIPHARLVDFVPTVLGLLGEQERLEDYPSLDGINLADELRFAKKVDEPRQIGKP